MTTTPLFTRIHVEFSTSAYMRSHGKQPSRTVEGCWAFQFEGSPEPWFAPSTLRLNDAKRLARQEAQRRAATSRVSHVTVQILP